MEKIIKNWLEKYADEPQGLNRFREPISYDEISYELNKFGYGNFPTNKIREAIALTNNPIYTVFCHIHAGRLTKSRPFALFGYNDNTCGLDWELPIVSGLKDWFNNQGYLAKTEVGTEGHINTLKKEGSLKNVNSGINQRDLMVHQDIDSPTDLWIIEVKGKQASGFDFYCMAECLGQVFDFPNEYLEGLLGSKGPRAHGHAHKIAEELGDTWVKTGKRINIALAIPDFKPIPLWAGNKVTVSEVGYFHRPINHMKNFILKYESKARTGQYKYERYLGEILEYLESKFKIRSLILDDQLISFHLLTIQNTTKGKFKIIDIFKDKDLVLNK